MTKFMELMKVEKINLPVMYDDITWVERKAVREQYVVEQDGKCWYCKLPLDGDPTVEVGNKWINKDIFPPDFLTHPIHLQHDHGTGLTEGAVHARCNAVLWQYYGR